MSLLLDNNPHNPSLLSLQNEHFRIALDQLEDVVLLVDLHGLSKPVPEIVYVNYGLLELSGFNESDLVGKSLSKIFGSRKLKLLTDRLDAIIENRGVYEFTNELKGSDSENIVCNWRVSCLFDDNNKPSNFLLTASAVTENLSKPNSKTADKPEKEIHELTSVPLTVRNEILAMQAGGIAHDFKNMLTTVVANLSLIRESIDDGETMARIEDAMKASREATDLASQLLTYSRGNVKFNKEEADVSQLLKDATRICTAGSKTRCDLNIQDGIWLSSINRTQIVQVINNLIINARHAMNDEGVIKVNLRNIEISDGEVNGLRPGKYLQLMFIDHGNGIEESDLNKIFKRFYTTKKSGSGLGLATCLSIIRDHGGTIEVSSAVGKGSAFKLYLPATGNCENFDQLKEIKKDNFLRGRVLVVDDDKPILEVSKSMLMNLGYDAEIAQSGEEGIKKFSKFYSSKTPFDVVIMDMTMPGGLDGIEASKKIIDIDESAKIITSSGYNDESSIEFSCKRNIFSGSLAKPYDMSEMAEIIEGVINTSSKV
ncbi:MAG: ATP-binding protein [Verrucomicrobiota bacterium]|nr:ATP-binding protein [Verrucomicrobiota bacterium]